MLIPAPMKRPWLIIWLILAAGAHAATVRDPYVWRAPLQGAWTNGALFVASIPPEVFDGSQGFPADLRIMDEHENAWPFYVTVVEPGRREAPWEVEVVEQARQTLPVPYLRYTVQLQARPRGTAPRHNRAVLDMGGHRYMRRVEVLGRADGADWTWLGEGYLMDRQGEDLINNRIVSYEASSFTQLQFRIYPSPHAVDEDLKVSGLSMLTEAAADEEGWLTLIPIADPETEERPGIQSIAYDVGFRNLSLRRLKLELGPTTQACPVKVYGRTTPTNQWRWVADGGVHRINGQVRDTVDVRAGPYRYLKIDLYHYEQPAPSVLGLRAQVENNQLVFEAGPGLSPHLYFGADRHPLPVYDLSRRVGASGLSRAAPALVGERARNPAHIAAILARYGRYLMLAVAGLLAGLGLVVLVNAWRRSNA